MNTEKGKLIITDKIQTRAYPLDPSHLCSSFFFHPYMKLKISYQSDSFSILNY
jgi:hypothetical protein